MKNFNSVLQELKIDDQQFLRLQKAVKREAIDYGKGVWRENNKELSSDDWDVMDSISDKIWYSELPLEKKIQLAFEFFDCLPSYYFGWNPVYAAMREMNRKELVVMQYVWDKLAYYVSRKENYYVDPTSYILWVEFFENDRTADIAWQGLMQSSELSRSGKINLLSCCGPVPYDAKEPLYLELIADENLHPAILSSLLFSATDVYGNVNKVKAKDILSRLKVSPEDEFYIMLQQKLTA